MTYPKGSRFRRKRRYKSSEGPDGTLDACPAGRPCLFPFPVLIRQGRFALGPIVQAMAYHPVPQYREVLRTTIRALSRPPSRRHPLPLPSPRLRPHRKPWHPNRRILRSSACPGKRRRFLMARTLSPKLPKPSPPMAAPCRPGSCRTTHLRRMRVRRFPSVLPNHTAKWRAC